MAFRLLHESPLTYDKMGGPEGSFKLKAGKRGKYRRGGFETRPGTNDTVYETLSIRIRGAARGEPSFGPLLRQAAGALHA